MIRITKSFQMIIAGAAIITISACKPANRPIEKMNGYDFYVGTYTEKESKGIYKYCLKEDGNIEEIGLAVETKNPSFLSKSADGKYIVAVNEINNAEGVGTVESYQINNDTLSFISRSSSGGAHPCYVSINDEGYVLTANYTGGNIGLHKINSNGSLTELLDLQQHVGQGTTERQKTPHAHSAVFFQSANIIIATDLGTNELWFYSIDSVNTKLLPYRQSKLSLPAGAGPRHSAIHPNNKWIYVINELNNSVSHVVFNHEGNFELLKSYSTLPKDFTGENYCADIHITQDGNFLYASNRGDNSIAIFNIDQDNGSLKLIGHESTRGEWPRNFSLSPDEKYLLVANQHSDNIVSFKRDKNSGLLSYVNQIESPAPVNILF